MKPFSSHLMASMALLLLLTPNLSSARLKVPDDKFVRSANCYLEAGTAIRPEDHERLARYDLLVLPAEAQNFNYELFASLRQLNPNITILAYVPTKSFNFDYWTDELHLNLLNRIDDSWWLRDPSGKILSVWPGTQALNTVSPWSRELPRYVAEQVWASGLWDGIFFDEFSTTIDWLNGGDIDLHGDGLRDNPELANVAWGYASAKMLRTTRELLGSEAVIMINGDSSPSVQGYVNGRMFESFPTPWEGRGRWQDSFGSYLTLQRMVGYKPTFIIGGDTGNSGDIDYRQVRFVLASTLMGDGFFAYDYGDQDHGQLWWYDEQNVNLGNPLGPPVNHSNRNGEALPGVWRRDFRNGVVLLNSTDRERRITFDTELERIRGIQDPRVNSGQLTREVTLAAHDGILLLKPVETIWGGSFPNGAFARTFNLAGQQVRNGFFAYTAPFSGSVPILQHDLDGDGHRERIAVLDGQLEIWDDKDRIRSFRPFSDLDEIDGLSVAAGDLDGDGTDEIVTGAGPGGRPLVRVFGADGRLEREFAAYGQNFDGGVDVAAGDLDGDGTDEIVTGAGPGGGPHVRVFEPDGRVISSFFIGDPTARGGINVSVSDTDHDGRLEIIGLTNDVFRLNQGNL